MSTISSTFDQRGPSRASAHAASQELSWLNRWVVLIIICVGLFMTTLDTGITDILNPTFTSQFHLDLYQEYWIELSFAIPLLGMLLPAGHMGDRLGRKSVFLTGIILFGGGSGLLTLMPNFESMFIARAIQGVGAALLAANGGVLAVSTFPWTMRGQVLGIIGAAVALGLKAGPVVGYTMAENFGWRSAFLINVAIGIVFVMLGAALIPESRRTPGRRFDVWGAVLFVLAVACFLVVVNQGPTLGWGSPTILLLAVGFVIFGFLFIQVSLRAPDPSIDLRLYKIRNFSVAVSVAFISFLALTPINHLLPFFMVHVQQVRSMETALVFVTTTLAIAFTQPISGRLADKIGSRPVASVGLLCQGLGLVILAVSPLEVEPDWLVPQLVLIGFGVGMFRSPNHRALFSAVPRDKMGQAGGYQHLPRQMGESIGETGVVTLFTAIVLSSAAMAGIQSVATSAAQQVAPVVAPTPAAVPKPVVAAQPGVPAVITAPGAAPQVTGQTAQPATTTGGATAPQLSVKPATSAAGTVASPARPPTAAAQPAVTGALLDDADGDTIVEVGEEGEGGVQAEHALSEAVVTLPPDVQIIGYRIVWALAGLIALGGAAVSWFLRDPEGDLAAAPMAAVDPANKKMIVSG